MPEPLRLVLLALAFVTPTTALAGHGGSRLVGRQSAGDPPVVPPPSYNISMPIDHFNASDKRTFNDCFYVNDTYYKPGGPVVYFDSGEAGYTDLLAAIDLAGWNGTVNAVTEVAKAFHGVIVALEHRYYGESHPFPIVVSSTGSYGAGSGVPVGGAADYRYLTVEQALEDVVYLAKAFDTLELGPRNTVLSGANATAHLGPDSTPWIWVGGSYPGLRAALSRLRSPEVWFAAWASSAVVQTEPGLSAYFNSIYRGLPKNCTSDVQAVMGLADEVLRGSDAEAKRQLKRWVWLAIAGRTNYTSLSEVDQAVDAFLEADADVAVNLEGSIWALAQSFGIHSGPQYHCDAMERFNVGAYLNRLPEYSPDSVDYYKAVFVNPIAMTPPPCGVAATTNASMALAAYLYALAQDESYIQELLQEDFYPSDSNVGNENQLSWWWQLLSELGFIQDTNATDPYRLTSTLANYTYYHANYESQFAPVITSSSAFPPQPDLDYVRSFGGWSMQPSNVMFTSGQFDPWRAYTVFSLEQETLGAPLRRATQAIPKCGTPPPGSDVFGLVYGGAAHAEDMSYSARNPRGSEGEPPVYIGSDLFIRALHEWLPCFKASKA
jgi:hypothetical protein